MRVLKWLALTVAALCLSLSVVVAVALQRAALSPPTISADLAKPGPGRAERVDDIWFVWLSGPPEVRGADMFRLTGQVMRRIDASMHDTFAEVIPSWPLRKAIEVFGRIAARSLGEDIPIDVQREIVGQMYAYDDPFDDAGGKFNRFMSYLALHDLAQKVEKSPLIACSGFAVTKSASASGGTLIGRNFDFEAVPIFDEQKAVSVFQPHDGYRFASVAWPGMNGVVTGINEKRVWISVNAARSDHEAQRGTPVSLLIRQALERAGTAAEAVAILSEGHTSVADLYLVADATSAFVVEKTSETSSVRGTRDDRIIVTNHFLDPALRAEARNQVLEQKTTSLSRFDRMQQTVLARQGAMDVAAALSVLRDRQLPSGEVAPVGDRRALDGFIATHGVIADLGRDTLWVSRAPHLSGKWMGIKLAALFDGRVEQAESLPDDPDSQRAGLALGHRKPNQ